MKYVVSPVYHAPSKMHAIDPAELREFDLQSACPACGEASPPETLVALGGVDMSESLNLVICRGCAHITYDRLPTLAWLDRYYRDEWDTTADALFQQKANRPLPEGYWKHFEGLGVGRGARILDFGCGFGSGLAALQKIGYENVYGVEPSTHRAEHAARMLPGRVRKGSTIEAAELAAEHGPFDVILSNHVVEHLRDPCETLRRLAPLLSDEGLFFLLVPDAYTESPVTTALFLPHLHLFNRYSFSRMLARLGRDAYFWGSTVEELVVAGAPAGAPVDWPEYRPCTEPFGEEHRRQLANFLAAPWTACDGGDSYLSYWHPYRRPKTAAGFQRLSGFGAVAAAGMRRLLPLVPEARQSRFVEKWIRYGRKLMGSRAPRAKTIIHLRPSDPVPARMCTQADSQVPWLVTDGARVPALLK